MRPTMRWTDSSARLRAFALVAILLGTPGVWLHDGRDDDELRLAGTGHRPGNGHGAVWTDGSTAPASAHCFLCHTLRALQAPDRTVAAGVSVPQPRLRELPVLPHRDVNARLLPPRSPPL